MRKALPWIVDGLLFVMSVPLAQSISFERSAPDLISIGMATVGLLIITSPYLAIIALARGWWLRRSSELHTAYVRALPYFAETAVMGCFLLAFYQMFHLSRDLLAAMAILVALATLLTFGSPVRLSRQVAETT